MLLATLYSDCSLYKLYSKEMTIGDVPCISPVLAWHSFGFVSVGGGERKAHFNLEYSSCINPAPCKEKAERSGTEVH